MNDPTNKHRRLCSFSQLEVSVVGQFYWETKDIAALLDLKRMKSLCMVLARPIGTHRNIISLTRKRTLYLY